MPQPRRQPTPGSRSCCSTSPTSAAASTACASRASAPTSRRSSRFARAGIAVGVAPHSVRACSRAWLEEIGAYATREGLPLHIHADEQPREIQECLEEHGCRPIELLADTGCLGERTTIIHATHANDEELDLLAATGARICACPTTESDLGDGFLRVTEVLDRSIPLCIGSDSNMRIDPLEELRELEGIARRQTGRRGILTTAQLLEIGSAEGARALQLEEWAAIEIDPDHRSLAGVAPEHVEAALIAGCTADVVAHRGSVSAWT